MAPSEVAVQLAPSPPSARLKSSDPLEPVLAAQVTATLVTLAEPIVPDPLATVQVCPDGFVFTVTAYGAPAPPSCANVNGPLAATDRSSPPLSCSTTVPDRPDTDPPTENDPPVRRAGHRHAGHVGRAHRARPVGHRAGLPGRVRLHRHAYGAPVATLVANVNGPLASTDRSSPPLSCSTTVPDRPDTDPPTENDPPDPLPALPPDQLSSFPFP